MTSLLDLTPLEILSAIFVLIFVIVSAFTGILFIIRYFKTKRTEQCALGLAWIFMSSGWWGSAFSFLSILVFGYAFQTFEYLLISNVFFPLCLIFWVYAFVHIFYQQKKHLVVIPTTIIILILDIILVCLLFIEPSQVGNLKSTFQLEPGFYLSFFQTSILIVALVTGLFFSIKSIQSEDTKIKWRGLILLIAFISIAVGGLLGSLFSYDLIAITIIRLVLISSAIEYYFAFFIGH